MVFTRTSVFLLPVLGALWLGPAQAAEQAIVIPAPAIDASSGGGPQTVVLAGGCFWGVQGVVQHTKGVVQAVSGYSGGSKDTAVYDRERRSNRARGSVEIKFDPRQISYGKILQIYFSVAHDPTQLNHQGRIPERNIARPSSTPMSNSSTWPRPMSNN